MPGGNVCEENLEQRIERIRKRDEEIEKKHREAEEDRLAALQANAMVKTTAPSDEDWPKAHKYDKLDFTYDVKDENVDNDEKKSIDETRSQRQFTKFADGAGPPADPSYNFLADAERDGKMQTNNASNENKLNWRVNNNNSNSTGSINNRRNNTNNSSFNRGNNGAKGKNPSQKGKYNDEPILRKNDRERNNEPRLQRQKSSDGMWRRNNDDKKIDGQEAKNHVKNSTGGKKADSPTGKMTAPFKESNKTSIQQRHSPIKSPIQSNQQQKLSDLSIEKRGNITVSVNKDGEVKSVKLGTARAIGTGRVGGTMRNNVQPQQEQQQQQQQQQQKQQQQQQQQQLQKQQQQQHQQQQQLQQQYISSPPPAMLDSTFNVNAPALLNYPVIDQFKPSPLKSQLQTDVQPVKPMINIINGVPFKLPSVQDRLIKNRVFFDEKLKTTDSTGNGRTVTRNQ